MFVTLLHDALVEIVSCFHPLGAVGAGEASLFCQAEAAVKGNPEHDLRVSKVLLVVADFPDGHVGIFLVRASLSLYWPSLTVKNRQDIIYG